MLAHLSLYIKRWEQIIERGQTDQDKCPNYVTCSALVINSCWLRLHR